MDSWIRSRPACPALSRKCFFLSQLQSSSSGSFRSDDDDEQPDVSFVFSGTNLCWMISFVDLHASIAEHMKIQNSNALSLPLAATASSRQSQSCRKIEHADAGGEHDLGCQTLVVCGPGWLLSCGRSIDQVSRLGHQRRHCKVLAALLLCKCSTWCLCSGPRDVTDLGEGLGA